MDFFGKVKNVSLKAAQQVGLNLIQSVTIVAHDMGITPAFAPKKPIDDFLSRFHSVIQILDHLNKLETSNSAESERLLNESKVRDHIREMLKHLQHEDALWVNSHLQSSDDEVRDHPCLEVFLQNHIMEELCLRAKKDRPRGCLPLVLTFTTSILKGLRYPLLPHQTVHKSLCQLIINTNSVSAHYTAMMKSLPEQKTILQAYIKKIDLNLVALICALWKRIAENPDLLTFFRFVDTRDGTKVKQHLDAIRCLIPLMGKPKVGLQAKEALLVAVSMRDRRVDQFILDETNLPHNIVSELVKKFAVCVSSSATFIPITPASSGIRKGEIAPGSAAVVDTSSKSSIVSFIKVLKFCLAFVAAASDRGCSDEIESYISIEEEDPTCASLQSIVCEHYRDLFLLGCVRPALLENGEQQVLIAQSLLRSILVELSPAQNRSLVDSTFSSTSPSASQLLCALTTSFVCEDKELLQALLPRAGSVSRSVSVSTLQLLSTLLGAASMRECCRLILSPEENNKEIQGESPITPSKSLDIDMTLNKLISGTATRFGSIPWVGRCNGHGVRENCSTNYMEAGLDRILSRLTGGIQCQGSDALLLIDPNIFTSSGSRPVGGPLLELTKRKLTSFLTLKYDEQVAVTGLVEKCMTVLSTLLVLSGSDPMGNILLKLFMGLFESVFERITELANHMKSLPEAPQKLEIICTVLNDPNCDQRYRRLIENESAQVVRILETSLIVRELFREFEGSLLAVRQLRLVLLPQGSSSSVASGAAAAASASSHEHTPSSSSTASTYTTPLRQTPASFLSSPTNLSLSPMSPFFGHSSPFTHVVHSSIHFAQHPEIYYSDSETEEGTPSEDEQEGEREYKRSDDHYHISDEELEERFLHECTLFEKDLNVILENYSTSNKNEEGEEEEEQEEEEHSTG